MNDRLWFVARDDDGYYSIPKAAYPNRLLAEATAYLANRGHSDGDYFADSIPVATGLPRIENALHLDVFLTQDGTRIVTTNFVDNVAHFDPEEADESPVISIHHERTWWNISAAPRAAMKIHAVGVDHDLVRASVVTREQQLLRDWPQDVWTAVYDVTEDHSLKRRRTREFDTDTLAGQWLAKRWRTGEIGPVQIDHWPTGQRIVGDKLERHMVNVT